MGARFDRFRQGNFAQTLKSGLPLISGLAGAAAGGLTAGPGGALKGMGLGFGLGSGIGSAGKSMLSGPSSQGGRSDFMKSLSGTPEGVHKIERFRPNQEAAMDALLSQGMEGLKDPYAGFDPIAQYAQKNYTENIVPEIMHQFIASGSNAPTSPGPWNQQGRSAEGLATNLAALRAQYGLQNRGQLMSLLGMGLSPRDEFFEQQAKEGAFDSIIPGLGRMISEYGMDSISALFKKLFGGSGSDVKSDLAESAGTSNVPKMTVTTTPIQPRTAAMATTLANYKR